MTTFITRDEVTQVFSNKLTKRLNELDMSQKELADLTGISEAAISRYVNGKRLPEVPCLISIAQALNCTVNSLLSY